jgi:hypothetical protein
MKADLNFESLERLEEQSALLLRTYHLELSKDPDSHATASSRSNLIALLHSITQIYGEDAAIEVKQAVGYAYAPAPAGD